MVYRWTKIELYVRRVLPLIAITTAEMHKFLTAALYKTISVRKSLPLRSPKISLRRSGLKTDVPSTGNNSSRSVVTRPTTKKTVTKSLKETKSLRHTRLVFTKRVEI